MTAQQMRSPTAEGVSIAAAKIAQLLPQTPLLEVEINGHTVWCKAECLQPIGAFGAELFFLQRETELHAASPKIIVATCSRCQSPWPSIDCSERARLK